MIIMKELLVHENITFCKGNQKNKKKFPSTHSWAQICRTEHCYGENQKNEQNIWKILTFITCESVNTTKMELVISFNIL